MLTDRVTALREANIYERQGYRHLVGLPAILGETDDGVRADTPFLVVRIMRDGAMDLFATGRYLDVLVEVGDALRFRERVVVCDSSRIDTLLAIPDLGHRRGPRRPPPSLPQNWVAPAKPALERQLLRLTSTAAADPTGWA